jgi:hypothetical protein
MPKLIAGEYDIVSRQTLNFSRLRASHRTSCDAAQAYFLIALMHEHAFPGAAHKPLVRLRKPRAGQTGSRGWGGIKKGRAYVSLPAHPMTDITKPYGKLRVGLVCHEYAHAVEMLKFGKSDHGARFTMILDELLFHTEQFWTTMQVQSSNAAEVK